MGIIKKKDILKRQTKNQIVGNKKRKPEQIVPDKSEPQIVSDKSEPIDELVDADGSHIEGNSKNLAANSEIETAPQQTTDDYAASAIQPNNYFYGIYGSPYSRGSRGGSYINAGYVRNAVNKIQKILNEGNKDA